MKQDDGMWFQPKSYGYGAGAPVSWQGWATLGVYVAVMAGAALLVPTNWPAFIAISVPATVALLVVASRKTRGGWRWRHGDGEG